MAASEGGEGGCSSGEERAYERPLQQGVAKEEGLRERAASLQLSVKQTTEKRQVGGCPPPPGTRAQALGCSPLPSLALLATCVADTAVCC